MASLSLPPVTCYDDYHANEEKVHGCRIVSGFVNEHGHGCSHSNSPQYDAIVRKASISRLASADVIFNNPKANEYAKSYLGKNWTTLEEFTQIWSEYVATLQALYA